MTPAIISSSDAATPPVSRESSEPGAGIAKPLRERGRARRQARIFAPVNSFVPFGGWSMPAGCSQRTGRACCRRGPGRGRGRAGLRASPSAARCLVRSSLAAMRWSSERARGLHLYRTFPEPWISSAPLPERIIMFSAAFSTNTNLPDATSTPPLFLDSDRSDWKCTRKFTATHQPAIHRSPPPRPASTPS